MPGVTMFYRGNSAPRGNTSRERWPLLRRSRTHEVLVHVFGARRGRDASLLSRPGAMASRLRGSGHEAGSRDPPARPDNRARVHHRSRPGLHGVFYQFSRLGSEVEAVAEEEIAIATDQGFQLWHALGTLHKGAGLLLRGRRDDALPLLLDGLQEFRGTGAELRVPFYLSMLGEAYTQAGRFEEAFVALNQALAVVDKNDDRFYEAELHRLKGELLLVATADQEGEAEVSFQRAIDIARRQQSKSWELRATVSLARLKQRQGRYEEAHAALAAVYGSWTKGSQRLISSMPERCWRVSPRPPGQRRRDGLCLKSRAQPVGVAPYRRSADCAAGRGQRDARRALPDLVPGHEPAVLRRLVGHSGHSHSGSGGPPARPVSHGHRRPHRVGAQRNPVHHGIGPARRTAARGGSASVSALVRAHGDCEYRCSGHSSTNTSTLTRRSR